MNALYKRSAHWNFKLASLQNETIVEADELKFNGHNGKVCPFVIQFRIHRSYRYTYSSGYTRTPEWFQFRKLTRWTRARAPPSNRFGVALILIRISELISAPKWVSCERDPEPCKRLLAVNLPVAFAIFFFSPSCRIFVTSQRYVHTYGYFKID